MASTLEDVRSSSDYALLYTGFALLLAWFVIGKLTAKEKPWKMVPDWLPIVGHYHYLGGTQMMGEVPEGWAKKHAGDAGCYEMDLMGVRYIVVCREDRAMEVLKQRPYQVQRIPGIREASDSAGATGVFSAEGQLWKEEKKLVAAALNRNNMNDFLGSMEDSAKRLLQKWERDIQDDSNDNDNKVVSVSLDIGHMTADAVSKLMLDRDFDFLNNPTSEMAHSVFTGFKGWILWALSPIWYWRIPVIGQDLDGYGKYYRYLNDIFNGVVDDFVREKAKEAIVNHGDDSSSHRKMFLGKLYEVMEREQSKLSRERVVGNIFTAFVAGIDTTSKTLITALYVLARDTSLQKELREHVKDAAGFATLQDMYDQVPVLKSFLHEVHRYYAVPFLVLRTAAEIPFCGTTLPAGQDVLILERYLSMKEGASDVPLGPDNASPSAFAHRRYLVPEGASIDDVNISIDSKKRSKWTCPGPTDIVESVLDVSIRKHCHTLP